MLELFAQPASRLATWLGRIAEAALYAAVGLVPLFFLPFTVDVLELGKQSLLAIVVVIGTLAWLGQALVAKRVQFSRSWLHLVVVVFLLGYGVTSFFSQDRYLSLVGNVGQMQWSLVTMVSCVLFYLLAVNVIRGTTKLYHLILAFLVSSILVGVFGVLQIFGVFSLGWLGAFARVTTFNSIGTINSLSVYMTIPLILASSLTVLGCKNAVCVLGKEDRRNVWAKMVVWKSIAVSLVVITLVDYWVAWAAVLCGMVLLITIPYLRSRHVQRGVALMLPASLAVVSIMLLLFKTPIDFKLPAEVSPSPSATWSIARQALQERPLFGSGPGTWIFDYAKYRQAAVNLTQFWSIRFERGSSSVLSLFAMIGLVGMTLWGMLVVSGVVKSARYLVMERDDDAWQAFLTVFTAWATVVGIAFVSNYNFAHHFVFWFLLALLAALVARDSVTWELRSSPTRSVLVSLGFIFVCVGLISGAWLVGQRVAADAVYAQAVAAFHAGKPIQESIERLESAVALNPWNDSYQRNLSQAYLTRASQELQGAGTDTERLKQGGETVKLAVDAARKAAGLSPANVDNWANEAIVLEAIASFTPGADEQALKMYAEASIREPNNPSFISETGRLHILRADAYRQLLQSNDAKVKKDAEQHIKDELDIAAQALNQAIQVKPDYAPAHYALGMVYERQGRVQDAVAKLEQVLNADSKNVGIAFQLAILYYRNNEKDKSLNIFEQLVAFDPAYSNARWFLSALYEERGRYDDAIAQVMKVKELNPGNTMVEKRLETLQQARDTHAKPTTVPLPEPVEEKVSGPAAQNQVKKP